MAEMHGAADMQPTLPSSFPFILLLHDTYHLLSYIIHLFAGLSLLPARIQAP